MGSQTQQNQAATGGTMARPLDLDINPWDQQPWEVEPAYQAFVGYRDSEHRKVRVPQAEGQSDAEHTAEISRRQRWSAQGSWAYRVRAWDRYVTQQDLDDLVRYRRTMNERHRTLGRVGLSKFAQWISNLNADTLRPMEAARLLEVATRIEREAAGANLAYEGTLPEQGDGESPGAGRTLAEMLGVDGRMEAELARMIHEATGR